MFQSKDVADQMVIFLTSPNEVARNQAHSYLLSFQASAEAWEVCRQLMVPSTQEIPLFLSSQIFYKKLQSDFPFLSDAQKVELKRYIFSLVLVPFNSSQVVKKICQSVAMVGVMGLASFWEDFIIDLLRLPKVEVMLDIVDCIPFCLEEFIIAKKVVELIKTKLRENIASIMQCLYLVIKEQGYLTQALQVIKNWRVVHIPVFDHTGLFTELIQNLYMCNDNFSLICEAFTTTVSLSSYAQLFQQSSGKCSISSYSSKIPSDYLRNLATLIESLSEIPFLNAQEGDVQRWGSELVISIANNFMFLLLEPIRLWDVIQSITGHQNLSVCMVAIEFYYNLRDILVSLHEIPSFIFEKLLMCIKSLALRCKIQSHEMFFKVIQQKSEDEEVIFTQFRISAEDTFYSIFLIFNKHHVLKGRGLIKELGGLLDGDEFNTEIFVFMMRSLLLGITEHEETQLLWEVKNN
jgi:hypothetical protein